MNKDNFNELQSQENGFYKYFKMTGVLRSSNLICFDENYVLTCFRNVNDLITYFYKKIFHYYHLRKKYFKKKERITIISNTQRFIEEICNKTIKIENVKESILIEELI